MRSPVTQEEFQDDLVTTLRLIDRLSWFVAALILFCLAALVVVQLQLI